MTEIADTDDIIQKFSTAIELPYDVRFVSAALDWTAELGKIAGCGQREVNDLRLALEETLTFLVNSYPDAESWEQIRLEFGLQSNDLIHITISNAGPPVHLNQIPIYNPENPSESEIVGLWYFLACNAVNELSFQNLGMDGWRAVIKKQLSNATFTQKASPHTAEMTPAEKKTFIARIATEQDADGLVDLTYETYRYTYPLPMFYHSSQLSQALKEKGIVSIVVETNGIIVGNSSMVISAHTPRCAYSCSLMLKPAFRKSQAIIYLLREINRYLASGELGVDLYYGNTVTTHTGSQKAGEKTGFKPLGLLLSACIAVDFRGMKRICAGRESFVIYVRFACTPTLGVIYLPERHQPVMNGLLTQAGFPSRLSADEAIPQALNTRFHIEEDPVERCATVMLSELSQDWATPLRKTIFTLKVRDIRTLVILIPAWLPVPPDLDAEMERFNAVFTGIKPISADECYLIYCAVSNPVDFDHILLADPLANALKEHCRQLYNKIFDEKGSAN